MAMKLSQSLKQTQQLMMTPQLQQAIKLLTLTHLEMTNVISQEMVENPMLEEMDGGEPAENKGESDYREEKLVMQNAEAKTENFDAPSVVGKDDFDWSTYIESYNNTTYTPPSMSSTDLDDLPNYENIISKGKNLPEHLEWQLRMEDLSQEEWELTQNIIHNINDDGYLSIPFEEILAQSKLEREHAFEILYKVQSLDPVGCGSENLKDCLLAQARILDIRFPFLEILINHHLKDLECKDYEKISKETGVNVSKIKDTEIIIQQLHPKPGRLITCEETFYVVPDIYVVQSGKEFVVRVNDEGVPNLKISRYYQNLYKEYQKQGDKVAKDYVEDKLRAAMWLIKSIHNRQRTILKVAEAIVSKQQEFFKKGVNFLKPMILRDIANEIGMHESTVSRVTTNKYMHTPTGLYELKYFFNSGIGGKNGGVDISSEVLKLKLKQLIDNENANRPLSDQKIAELLSREDVAVARRTVAKYREMMGILGSSKRKKRKNADKN
ncbi:MAG: RNA polymerase sigma-54 factor [Bdellovibrionales bacterium RIFOXYB1_FULL_37_110]|nr:MAG: RNA polymerase sigma-54 factor [Bdellovibrionales bacterium RIFOXYC1_FULL_37_79]OFZ57019.1 MAG: RNA polymerase sigma-54 factor [Bdellovibrionales bacterium RIFOXYB1_FULL_37_110]OFZ64018.1 MAG: RNA polymerase sigma-54 factor [Bdellovibrionales bacterium RIFOXYD1_FULL_36_51]